MEGWAVSNQSHHFQQLWDSVVITFHSKKKVLWLNLLEVLFCGYKHKYFKGNLTGTSCPLSNIAAVASWLGVMASLAMSFWSSVEYQTWIPSNQRVVGYTDNAFASMAPPAFSQAGHRVCSWADDCPSALVSCSTTDAHQKEQSL